MDRYTQIEKNVLKILSGSPTETDGSHARSTKKWLLKLKPDANRALQIAALAHDIERAYSTPDEEKKKEDFTNYRKIKTAHGRRSADIICGLLKAYSVDDRFVKRVRFLVENHELGGDGDCNVLKEADSISFFEKNLELYFNTYGREKTRDKVCYMYDRMSKRGKDIVREFQYENHELSKLVNAALPKFAC